MSLLRKFGSLFKKRAPEEDIPPRAVVLLLREPVTLTEAELRGAIFKAWGWHIGVTDAEAAERGLLVAAMPTSVVIMGEQFFIINSLARPYFDNPPQSANETPELRQRQIVLDNKAWLSVDVIRPENPSPTEKSDLYRRLCRLAVEFLSPNCLGVYLPETGTLRAHDGELDTALRSEYPLQAVSEYPYVPAVEAQDEERLDAAVAEARRRWPEFVQAFLARNAEHHFSVKAPFSEGKYCEWMWINVLSIDGDVVMGELGNTPVNLKNVHEGDIVRTRFHEIGDWLYNQGDDTPVGGFTIPILLKPNSKN